MKLKNIYQQNAPILTHWAHQGLPYAVLTAVRGHEDITPLFASKSGADKMASELSRKGLSSAVVWTSPETGEKGNDYRFYIKPRHTRGSQNLDF